MLESRQEIQTCDRVKCEWLCLRQLLCILGLSRDTALPSNVKMKPKNKSKKKTERDNVRAARFQAKKRQEKDAAAPEAFKDDPLPTTSSPRASGPSTFAFAEPIPENVT